MNQVEETMKRIAQRELREEGRGMQKEQSRMCDLAPGAIEDLAQGSMDEIAHYYKIWLQQVERSRKSIESIVDDMSIPKAESARRVLIELGHMLFHCHTRLADTYKHYSNEIDPLLNASIPDIPNRYHGSDFLDTARRSGVDVSEPSIAERMSAVQPLITPAAPRYRTAERPSEEQLDKIEELMSKRGDSRVYEDKCLDSHVIVQSDDGGPLATARNIKVRKDYFAHLERSFHTLINLMWAAEPIVAYGTRVVAMLESVADAPISVHQSQRKAHRLGNLVAELSKQLAAIHNGPDAKEIRESMARAIKFPESMARAIKFPESMARAIKFPEGDSRRVHEIEKKVEARDSAEQEELVKFLHGDIAHLSIFANTVLVIARRLVDGVINDEKVCETGKVIATALDGELTNLKQMLKIVKRSVPSSMMKMIEGRPSDMMIREAKERHGIYETDAEVEQSEDKDPKPISRIKIDEAEAMLKDGRLIEILNSSCEEIFLDTQVDRGILEEFCQELDTGCRMYDDERGYRVVINSTAFMYIFRYIDTDTLELTGAKRVVRPGTQTQVEVRKTFHAPRVRDLKEIFTLITRNEIGNADELRDYLIGEVRHLDNLDKQPGEDQPAEDEQTQPQPRPRVGQRRIIRIEEQTLRELVKMIDTVREDNTHDGALMVTGVLLESKFKVDAFDVTLEALPGTQEGGNYEVGATGLPFPEQSKDEIGDDELESSDGSVTS